MAKEVSAIGIKQIYYADPLEISPTEATIKDLLDTAKTTGEVKNVHQDTWEYTEEEGTTTEYKNQLTGNTYRSESEPGSMTINFSIGQYDFQTKQDLQGGKVSASGNSWSRTSSKESIYKSIYAITEDNVCIVFPKARIIARNSSLDNAIAIAVTATPEEAKAGMAVEDWFDLSEIETSA